jgi:hypothetical protein
MPTGIRRLERSIECSFWTTGSTKTLAPSTTFWPEESREITPLSLVTSRPWRPVTMKAWLGPATLIRDSTSRTSRITRTAMPPTA